MAVSGTRDHVVILDFAARFAGRAQELLRHSGYQLLTPASAADAIESFKGLRGQIAFVLAAAEEQELALAMQSAESNIRVFLFDSTGLAGRCSRERGDGRKRWLSSLGTFP